MFSGQRIVTGCSGSSGSQPNVMRIFSENWYVLYTRPCHEKKTFEKIAELEAEVFMPTVKVLRQWHDRKKYVTIPLFPSYIFVYLRNIREYYDCLEIDGAVDFVRFGKEIAIVGKKVIEDIKLITGSNNEIEVSTDTFAPGRHFFIQDGPLTGLTCEIVKVGKNAKALVRVTLLKRCLLVTIYSESLLPVPVR